MYNVTKIFGTIVQEIWISLNSSYNAMLANDKMSNFDEISKSTPPMRHMAKRGA
jgi:hypothetical protein